MSEKLQEGKLVGVVLKESETTPRQNQVALAKVIYDGEDLKFKFPSQNYREDLDLPMVSTKEPGIQYIFPELSPILDNS